MQKKDNKTGTTVTLNKSPLHFNRIVLWQEKLKKGGNIAKESTSMLLNKFFSLETGSLLHFAPTYNLCEHLPHVFLGSFSVFCFRSEVTFDLPKKGCFWPVGLVN